MARARQPLESSLERSCRNAAFAEDAFFIKLHHSIAGLPDRILLRSQRRVTLVELKRGDAEPTKIQQHWHRVLRSMGYQVEVVRSLAEFRDLLTE